MFITPPTLTTFLLHFAIKVHQNLTNNTMKKYIISTATILTIISSAYAVEVMTVTNTQVAPQRVGVRMEAGTAASGPVQGQPMPTTITASAKAMPATMMVQMAEPIIMTGDAAIDTDIKALQDEMQAKIKAIRDEYQAKIKAKIGNRPSNFVAGQSGNVITGGTVQVQGRPIMVRASSTGAASGEGRSILIRTENTGEVRGDQEVRMNVEFNGDITGTPVNAPGTIFGFFKRMFAY